MQFTNAQFSTFANHIRNNAAVASFIATGNNDAIADWYNQPSTFVVWRTLVTEQEITGIDGFNWTLIDGLTQGKRDEWVMLFNRVDYINPSKANVRAGILDVWSGNAAKLAVNTAILDVCKRFANRVEQIFVTGTGTTATPGLLGLEGTTNGNQVDEALRNY